MGIGSCLHNEKDIVRLSFIMATLFEKILRGEVPSHRAASGDGWYAFLDIFPRREGHTLVIPTRGVQRLAALDPQEQGALMEGVTFKPSWAPTFKPRTLRFAFMMDRSPVRKFPMFMFMSSPGRPVMAVVR